MSTIASTATRYELIDGCEIEKPLPKKLHFFIQSYLVLALRHALSRAYIAGAELNILTGDRTPDGRREFVVPDVVVVDRGAKYEDGDLAQPPLLAIEILSPGQTIGDMFNRAERLLRLGTPVVWVVWPEKRQAWERTSDSLVEKTLTLSAGIDAVEIQLAEMWSELD